MLLFIGGAARTGKGILVRRLLAEMQLPYLSLDVLKMGLTRGVPEYDIDPDAGGIHVSERLWPLVREMSVNLIEEGVGYVIEGEVIPKYVDALRREYPTHVKACFLGYTTITPEQKLHNIRMNAGYPNDWPSAYSDAELLDIIKDMITFSQYLMDECVTYQLCYFDTSDHFVQTLDEVVAYIQAEMTQKERR